MELRSCHHLHFIKSSKGGLVIKTLNVNCGRPALKVKKIEDIYESGDARNHDSLPTFQPKEEFERLPFDCDSVKVESPCLPMEERTTKSDPEAPELNCSGDGDGRNSDLDDPSFGNMTLKQIKERCKAKKRKLSSYVDLSKETVETCSHVKQDYLNLQPKDDECDLEQPLSSWKSNLSKKMKCKKKKKCMKNHLSTSSQTALAVVKSESISSDHEFLQSGGDFPVPIDIKVVVPEPDYSDCRDIICVAPDPSPGCNEQMDSCGWLSNEVPETGNDCVLATGVTLSSTEDSQCCVVNELPYEYMEHEPNSVYDVGISGWEIVKVDIPEIISQEYPDLPRSEFDEEGYVIHPLPHDIYSETISPTKDHSSDMYADFLSYPSMHEMSLQTTSDSQAQLGSLTFNNRLQCSEYIDGGSACLFEDETRNDLPSNLEARAISLVSECRSSWNFNSCLSPDSCSVSAVDDSPSVEEKQSQSPACADIAKNCSTAIHPCDATDKLTTSAGLGDHYQTKPHHHPERLFSTRKFQAISPISQARLCKAMESIESHDNEQYKCRGKLYFGKQTKNKIIRAEGPGQIRRAEVSTNRKQSIRKPKYDTEGSHPKGILKDPHHSRAVPSFSTRCSSIQSCSQSAIAFSHRQMQDIEFLATRLTKELNSMKDILKETLYFEACSATALKHNVDKVTMAIENATKVEESGKRFLSMMARDCSRFCKIMRLSEEDSAASNNVVPRKMKKITFADEVGKKLCHVKVFEDDTASLMESSGEKR